MYYLFFIVIIVTCKTEKEKLDIENKIVLKSIIITKTY